MDVEARARLAVPPERAHAVLADLATYPAWLGIVQRAEPAGAHPEDTGPAWWVDIGARLGPLRRTKRVRMVRTGCEVPDRVRFERVEHDGRTHPEWILTGLLEPVRGTGGREGSELSMHLHYGGSRSLPVADVVLAAEVRRAGGRLDAYLRRAD